MHPDDPYLSPESELSEPEPKVPVLQQQHSCFNVMLGLAIVFALLALYSWARKFT